MPSERLLNFLEDWCGLDSDIQDAADMLNGPGGAYYLSWLPEELARAIRDRAITPELMSGMLTLHFDNQEALDRWLRRRWEAWFTLPYPG